MSDPMTAVEIGADTEFSQAGGGTFGFDPSAPEARPVVAEEPDWSRVELVRRLACRLSDGGALVLGAVRPVGATGHGDEVVAAALHAPDGTPVDLVESRLTTEYDSDGEPRRIGLELLTPEEDEPAMRGAGTRQDSGRFDFILEGTPGTAVYELVRPG